MGLFSSAHPNLPQAQTNEGTIVIARPNKTFLVIASLNTPAANASLYDPATQTFTAQSGASIPTAANGGGGFALKRPDGKFLVVMGSSTNVTNIYNADTNTFSLGPTLSGVAALGASAIPNTDGTYTIVHGGALTTSSLYDPVRNTMIAGPVLTTAANCGFFAIPLQNGTYKTTVGVAPGVAGATTAMIYNPSSKAFSAGTAFTTAHGCGAFAFQKSDGQWLSVTAQSGAAGIPANSTNIINAANGTTIAGPALSAVASRGTHMIPRADGTFLIIHASSSVALSTIYDPNGSTFAVGTQLGSTVAGPSTLIGQGVGAISFQRPDGKWVMINGSSTASVLTYDAGWYAEGQYLSEQMNVPALAANSTLEWKQTPDNFVRMEIRASTTQAGLSSTGYSAVGTSGSSINNAGGETWVQVVVNFRRDFPTFSGALSGVYNTGGGLVYPYRTISLPTVSEYKVNNGMDLLTLQDNGLNVMRVTTSGNVYTGSNGGFYSGGADLAERYTSTDYLEPGDVVVSDYMNNHGVKKSTGAYQEGMLGVVSTAPGFIAGAFTEDSYPIGLVGRVPVKVSTENGPVRAGDYLTSASIPGYAMKATYAGRVIGKAMEDLTEANTKVCPGVAAGLRENVKCGVVMMFVNLVDYKGGSIQVAMDEWSANHADTTSAYTDTGLSAVGSDSFGVVANGATSTLGFNSVTTTHDTEVLAFLKKIKEENEANLNGQSDIFAQNVHVISEIIAPKIVTDILAAREAHITNIEGFSVSAEVITAKKVVTDALVSTAGDMGFRFTADGRLVMFGKSTSTNTSSLQVAGTSTESVSTSTDVFATSTATSTATTIEVSIFGPDEVIAFDMKGNAFFAGEIVAKEVKTESLSVSGQAVLRGGLLVNTIGTDNSVLALLGDVEFFGRPYFNHDMGGTAIIKKGAKSVEIIFDKEYIESPSVVASISFSDEATSTLEIRELAAFDETLKFIVTKRNTKGFTILLNKATTEDMTFMWLALAIKDSKVFTSLEVATTTPESTNNFTTNNTVTDTLDTNSTTTEETTGTTTETTTGNTTGNIEENTATTENVTDNTSSTTSDIPVTGQ
jgi:hypothetical protein